MVVRTKNRVVEPVVATVVTRPRRPGSVVGPLLLLIGTLGALGHVAVHLKSFEVGYELGKERRLRGELEERRRRLTLEIGVLKDPGRMMTVARDRLGLAPPLPTAIVGVAALGAPPPEPTATATSPAAPAKGAR